MSFSDFAGTPSSSAASRQQQQQQQRPSASTLTTPTIGSAQQNSSNTNNNKALNMISDSLLQYQVTFHLHDFSGLCFVSRSILTQHHHTFFLLSIAQCWYTRENRTDFRRNY
jgi:hypothetical protein